MARNTVEVLINMKKSGTGDKDAVQGLDGVMKAIKAAGAIMAAQMVVNAAKATYEFAKLGAESLRTRAAFVAISGGASEASKRLEAMQRATRGALSEQQAMASANKLMQMGLVGSADELEKVAGMAVRLGSAMGMDAAGAVEEFGAMLANQSIPRLDRYGISSGNVRARMEELRSSTAGMTREAAFMQAVMEQGNAAMTRLGPAEEDAALASERLEAAWADLKTMAAEALAPAAAEVAEALTDGVRGSIEAQRTMDDYRKVLGATAVEEANIAEQMGFLTETTEDDYNAMALLAQQYEQFAVGPAKSVMQAEMEAAGVFDGTGAAVERMRLATETAASAQYELATAAGTVAGAFGEIEFDDKTLWKMALASGASLESLAGLAGALGIATDAEIANTLAAYGLVEGFAKGTISAAELDLEFEKLEASTVSLEEKQVLAEMAMGDVANTARSVERNVSGAGTAMDRATGKADQLEDDIGGLGGALDTAAGHAGALTDQINAIPTDITVHFNWDIPPLPPEISGSEEKYGLQAGGIWRGGVGWVGEGGPELAILPRGTRVIPHYEAAQVIRQANDNRSWSRGGDTIIVNDQLAAAMLLAERGRSIERRIARGI